MRVRTQRTAALAAAATLMVAALEVGAASAATAKPVSITVFNSKEANIGTLSAPKNWLTDYVDKHLNVRIQWVLAPTTSNGVQQKEQLLLASGDYPTAFFGGSFTPSQVLQYGKEGVFIPLNHLIQRYAPAIVQAMHTIPGLKQAMVAPDGNIYAIPTVNECYHTYFAPRKW